MACCGRANVSCVLEPRLFSRVTQVTACPTAVRRGEEEWEGKNRGCGAGGELDAHGDAPNPKQELPTRATPHTPGRQECQRGHTAHMDMESDLSGHGPAGRACAAA